MKKILRIVIALLVGLPVVVSAIDVGLAPNLTFAPASSHVTTEGTFDVSSLAFSLSPMPIIFTASESSSGICSVTTAGVVTIIGPGNCVITASQVGGSAGFEQPTFAEATPVTLTFTITAPVLQTITFDPISDVTLSEPDFSIGVSSDSGLTVSLTVSGESEDVCEFISAGTIHFLGAGTCTILGNQEGNSSYLAAEEASVSFNVTDGDGVSTLTENAGPNSGDGNGDGTNDSDQPNVVTAPDDSLPGDPYVTLEVMPGTFGAPIITSYDTSSKLIVDTSGSTLPIGVFSFRSTGGYEPGSAVTINIYLDKVYDTTGWTLQKQIVEREPVGPGPLITWLWNLFMPTAYASTRSATMLAVPGATFSTVTIGGVQKTKITYSIRDGEQFDDDGTANGAIVDPVFVIVPIVTPTPIATGGGGNGPVAGSLSAPVLPTAVPQKLGSVLGVSTSSIESCDRYLTKFIKLGAKNDSEQVLRLQKFLSTFENMNVPTNGIFDSTTYAAVKSLQTKYGTDVLAPWGLTDPTGFTYLTTRKKVNELYCKGTKQFPLTDAEIALIEAARRTSKNVPIAMPLMPMMTTSTNQTMSFPAILMSSTTVAATTTATTSMSMSAPTATTTTRK